MRHGPQWTDIQPSGQPAATPTLGGPDAGTSKPLSRQDFYELLDAAEVQAEAARLRAKLTSAGESAAARQEFDAAIADLNAAATRTGIWR